MDSEASIFDVPTQEVSSEVARPLIRNAGATNKRTNGIVEPEGACAKNFMEGAFPQSKSEEVGISSKRPSPGAIVLESRLRRSSRAEHNRQH